MLNFPNIAATRHRQGNNVVACNRCLKPCVSDGFGSGYATLRITNERVCYDCSNEIERSDFATANTFFAYLSGDGKTVSTWSGGTLALVSRERTIRSGFGGRMTTIQAIAPNGSHWYGRGSGRGMSIKLHRVKGT